MNKIAKELGIDGKINTYEARHSFATSLLRSEAPLTFISRSLGHGSLKTTQKYLGSFEDIATKRYVKDLVPKQTAEELSDLNYLKYKAEQCNLKFPAIIGERMANQVDDTKIESTASSADWVKYFAKWESTAEGSDFWFEIWLRYKEHGESTPQSLIFQFVENWSNN